MLQLGFLDHRDLLVELFVGHEDWSLEAPVLLEPVPPRTCDMRSARPTWAVTIDLVTASSWGLHRVATPNKRLRDSERSTRDAM
ncbi:MAG: hypothetical protein OEV40_31615 [Acidimicrobiia bacterium]|nr:hypothetical protein [Acidimicrobiia bacterium]